MNLDDNERVHFNQSFNEVNQRAAEISQENFKGAFEKLMNDLYGVNLQYP